MSLLLDAFKKSRHTNSGVPGDGLQPDESVALDNSTGGRSSSGTVKSESEASALLARNTGRNLFAAKASTSSQLSVGGINRNLLIALGATILLLGSGAAYLWYMGVFDSAPLPPPRIPPAPIIAKPSPAPIPPAEITASAPPPDIKVTETLPAEIDKVVAKQTRRSAKPAHKATRTKQEKSKSSQPATVAGSTQNKVESLNTLIANAYRAFRSGNYDDARLLYTSVIDRDNRNTDALLGLGAIAQRLGADSMAAQYFLRVLEIDPRNPVANAGMSALSQNPNSESLLKGLLREQRDSAALHFALGNVYSGQSRWGEAQTAYFNAYSIDSTNAELALNLAVSLDHLGQKKMAIQYYGRALELDKSNRTPVLDHNRIAQRVTELAD
jgi:Flp pilus assembly protein TadD